MRINANIVESGTAQPIASNSIRYNYTTGMYQPLWDDVDLVIPIGPRNLTMIGERFVFDNTGTDFSVSGDVLTVWYVAAPTVVVEYTFNANGFAVKYEGKISGTVQYTFEWQAPAGGGIPFGDVFVLFVMGTIISLVVVVKKKLK